MEPTRVDYAQLRALWETTGAERKTYTLQTEIVSLVDAIAQIKITLDQRESRIEALENQNAILSHRIQVLENKINESEIRSEESDD